MVVASVNKRTGFSDTRAGAQLIITRKGSPVRHYRLKGKRTTIGRSVDSDICISSRYISWDHAVIDFNGNAAFIVDLCSKNRTLVNEKEIENSPLRDGDVISIGYHRIHYVDSDNVETPQVVYESEDESKDKPEIKAEIKSEDESANESIGAEPAILESVSREDVESIVFATEGRPESLLAALNERFAHQEDALTHVLGEIFDYEIVLSQELMRLNPDFDALDLATCRDKKVLLVHRDENLTAVICDPFDPDIRLWVESRFPQELRWLLASAGGMKAYVARHEQSMKAMDAAIPASGESGGDESDIDDLSLASISQDSSPVVKLVHSTLYDALRAGASDIHMEAGVSSLEIRYRIDGVLAHVASVSGADVTEQVISRIKVMSELDIAERRIPQDGRFKSSYDGRPIDFRVSIMPSSFGEDAVLRVLDKQAVTDQMTDLSLDSLGFDKDLVQSLRKLSERPYGMLLVTGPTGSGKTTTLYGAISETNSGLGKIVTIEDPVEYQLSGVLQIPVNEKKGLTFARGLRSILRHDPDKIMVGEIRDPETAQIAIQSALTGHLVFTTVHANNVFDVLSRFLHMGVDAYSFVSALNGILAQRLLRIVCHHCGERTTPTQMMIEATGVEPEIARNFNWRAGTGCGECRGTGYRGRRAVGELLVLNDEMREAIIGRVPVRQLKELARQGGVRFIRDAAIELVRDGLTTIEEVDRVTTLA